MPVLKRHAPLIIWKVEAVCATLSTHVQLQYYYLAKQCTVLMYIFFTLHHILQINQHIQQIYQQITNCGFHLPRYSLQPHLVNQPEQTPLGCNQCLLVHLCLPRDICPYYDFAAAIIRPNISKFQFDFCFGCKDICCLRTIVACKILEALTYLKNLARPYV